MGYNLTQRENLPWKAIIGIKFYCIIQNMSLFILPNLSVGLVICNHENQPHITIERLEERLPGITQQRLPSPQQKHRSSNKE